MATGAWGSVTPRGMRESRGRASNNFRPEARERRLEGWREPPLVVIIRHLCPGAVMAVTNTQKMILTGIGVGVVIGLVVGGLGAVLGLTAGVRGGLTGGIVVRTDGWL